MYKEHENYGIYYSGMLILVFILLVLSGRGGIKKF
jgi:hypothetical protein